MSIVFYVENLPLASWTIPCRKVSSTWNAVWKPRAVSQSSNSFAEERQNLLPLDRTKLHSIAVIGANADKGMLSGGGSAQVDPQGLPNAGWQAHVWFPPAPLKSLRAAAPGVDVQFNSGAVPSEAAALAKQADVAIVFAHQWISEDMDLKSLALPDHQDSLIDQVATANPHTIIVLESGTAVTMPWLDKTSAVLEAWYPGQQGGRGSCEHSLRHRKSERQVTHDFSSQRIRSAASPNDDSLIQRSGTCCCHEDRHSKAHI